MNDYEEYVNSIHAIRRAEELKKYCSLHKNCNDCIFGSPCELFRHPCDWDFEGRKKKWIKT